MEKFEFSSTVVHQLLIRSVYSDREDELRFRFGDRVCRFGKVEFAIITGLYFGEVEPDIVSVEEGNCSSLIEYENHVDGDVGMATAPFHVGVSKITIGMLQKALMDATDPEIAYKLGLIYLIESVLHGKAMNSYVTPFVFQMADDVPQFLHYSWGSYFWDITLKNLKGKQYGLTIHIGKKSIPTKPVECLLIAFFVWAYEALPSVGCLIAECAANTMAIPRMLRWCPMKGNIKHNTLSMTLDAKGLGMNTYLKPIDTEANMLRDNGLVDDEFITPPPVYNVPRDESQPTVGGVGQSHASKFDTLPDGTPSEHIMEFDRNPSKRHKSVTAISQVHTELLGLKTYAHTMNKEVLKTVEEYNEDMIESIMGVGNEIKYGEKNLQCELTDMKNAFRDQYISLRSSVSAMLSSKNCDEFNRPPQPSTMMMWKGNDYEPKVSNYKRHPGTGDVQLQAQQNQQPKEGRIILDKKTQTIPPSTAFTADKHFYPHPHPPQTHDVIHHGLSMHVVKRGIDARNHKPSTSKKVQLGPKTMMKPLSKANCKGTIKSSHKFPRPDLIKEEENFGDPSMMRHCTARSLFDPMVSSDSNPRDGLHKDETSISDDEVHFGDKYRARTPKAKELSPDPWAELNDNLTPKSNEFILNPNMGKSASAKMRKGDDLDDAETLSDSTHSSPTKPRTRKAVSTPFPICPRSRRPTQRPGKLQDFVDQSTLERNKCKRYDPFRPIVLGQWLALCAWYNDPDSPDMKIDGVYYNLSRPMEEVEPFWFQTLYKSKQWLDVSHVNAYMYIVKGRMQKHQNQFKPNVCLFSHELGEILTQQKPWKPTQPKVTKTTSKKRKSECDAIPSTKKERDAKDKSMLKGVLELTAQSTVYTPYIYGGHWVALVISIPSWKVDVYDCMLSGKNDGLNKMLHEIANNLPAVLKNSPNLMKDRRITKPFTVKQSKVCRQMEGVGDCGVFTVKYIEHLILKDANLKDVNQENMELFRDKMCVDIFHKIMDF